MECKNCHTVFEGNFCPNCGQRSTIDALTLNGLFESFVSQLFYFERHFVFTFKSLFKQPQILLEEFSHGQRKKYANPFQFFLFFLTIYLVLYAVLGDDLLKNLGVKMQVDGKTIDRSTQVLSIKENLDKYMNYLYFLRPISLAVGLKMLHFKRMNFAQALVMAFYVEGINLFIGSIMMFPSLHFEIGATQAILGTLVYAIVFSRISDSLWVGAIKGVVSGMISIAIFGGLIAGYFAIFIINKG
ncbi:MAG: DUF3667 domain-containing protein [Flavobacteriales bacterium]|nr:DUF3667 domain-containing protein [Flavobacteriales bacterium]